MAKKLNYGLIGCGGCGVGKHLASYAQHPKDVELYGVYDFEAEKARAAAEKYQVPHVFDTYEALLADPRIDVVSVVTPNKLHAPVTIAALRAGKHVHVEKPIAMNAAEAQAIVDAKNAAGKKVMVALNNRFTDMAQFIKRYIEEGNLGEIYHARCGWHRRRGMPGWGGWFTTKALSGGGPLIDLGVHFIDLTLYMLGFPTPQTVSAAAYNKFGNKIPANAANPKGTFDVEDLATGFIRLANDTSIAFEYSWASNIEGDVNYMELLGTKGGLSLRNGKLAMYSEVCGRQVDITPNVPETSTWGGPETRHFIECLQKNHEPIAKPEEAVTMMQIIDAIYASAETKREVVIGELAEVG